MKNSKCLYCYDEIEDDSFDYHPKCSQIFFGIHPAPILEYSLNDIANLGEQIIHSLVTIPGVQQKISLGINKRKALQVSKPTIMGLWGEYILKPPSSEYESLPENESLTMKLANLFNIETVPNSLIKLKSGELAYITKRIDRHKKSKLPMEDMAQLCNRLTSEKYLGSLEQIGKAIMKYSSNPGFDVIKFFEINLFSFITGNSDMHLKNFSIIYKDKLYLLAPAYDLISTRLVISEKLDSEEFALTMNGKKSRFKLDDFMTFSEYLNIPNKAIDSIFNKFRNEIVQAQNLIRNSFLNAEFKEKYIELITSRAIRLDLYPF